MEEHFSQLLNVHNISDVRHIEIHISEPLVPCPSCLELEIFMAKLKMYKPSGGNQIPAELIKAGGGMWLLLYHFTNRMIKLTVIIIMGYHCY
jgi:hypothetical protein